MKTSDLLMAKYDVIMLKAAMQEGRTDESEEFIKGLMVAYVDVAEMIKGTAQFLKKYGQ